MIRYTSADHPYLSVAEIERIHARARQARAIAMAAFFRYLRRALAMRLRAFKHHGVEVAVPKAGAISLNRR
jgi:hypothetical protein